MNTYVVILIDLQCEVSTSFWHTWAAQWSKTENCFLLAGTLNEDYLRELLTTLGDRFTQDEVDDLYKEAPIKNGQFDYVEFTRILKHGAKDPDDK